MGLDPKVLAASGVAAAVGVGLYLKSKSDAASADDGPGDGGKDVRTQTYNPFRSRQLTTGPDRGLSISAVQQNAAGREVRAGVEHYRYGNTVICNRAVVFGAKSYRHSMCLPSANARGGHGQNISSPLYGISRSQDRSNPGNWKWDRGQYMDGEGWAGNGACIVARSWSCKAANTQGPNNVNCRRLRAPQALNLGAAAGGMGFFPYSDDSDVRAAWLNSTGEGVPLISYNSDPANPSTPEYMNLTADRSKVMSGFVDGQGNAWIEGKDTANFWMITDTNPDVKYYYSMQGASGMRAARNSVNGRNVPRAQWSPRWKNLSNVESMQFSTGVGPYAHKIDPWSITGSPWQKQDVMENSVWSVGGVEYILDFARGPATGQTLNGSFMAIVRNSGHAASISRNIIGRQFVSFKNMALPERRLSWPCVSYGQVYPWQQPNTINGNPFDFCMPVFMSYWTDMPVDANIFKVAP